MLQKSNKILYVLVLLAFQAFCQTGQKLAFSEGLAPKRDEVGLIGFVNDKGKYEIKPSFDAVLSGFRDGYAVVVKDSKTGVIDSKGKSVIPFKFSDVAVPFSEKLIPVKNENGLWGFYSKKGKAVIPFYYDNFRFRDKGKIIVQKNGLWGVINSKGSVLLDHDYRELDITPDNKFYRVNRYNHFELKDMESDKSRTMSFDSLHPAGNGVLKYYMLGKYGLVDMNGSFITQYKYDFIDTEDHDYFLMKIWDKYGVLNKSGEEVIPASFDKILIDSLGIRVAVKNKEGKLWWGLYSREGKEILAPGFPFIGEPGGGLVPAKAENGLWRYIDFKGKTQIPFKFSQAGPFKNGVAEVVDYMNDSRVVIDGKGKMVVNASEYPFYKAGLLWLDRNNDKIWKVTKVNYDDMELLNKHFIRVKKYGKLGLLSVTDHLVVPCKYDFVSEPSVDGYIVVQQGEKWGVLDKKGKVTLALSDRFDRIYPFHEGFAKVLMKGRYGFIDSRGNVYVSPQYPDAGHVSDGMVSVKINGKWGYVNTDEKLLVQPYYDIALPFQKGAAVVYQKRKYNLVNKQGKELHPYVNNIKETSTGKYLLIKDGKYGLADASGKEILPIKYDLIKEARGGYLIVNLRGLYGVLDTGNNIVIPITYNFIDFDPFNGLFICGSDKGFQQIKVE